MRRPRRVACALTASLLLMWFPAYFVPRAPIAAAGEAEADGYTGQYVRVRAKAQPGQLCRVRILAREGTLASGEVVIDGR